MLYDIDGKRQTRIPHEGDYQEWRSLLRDRDHAAILAELHRVMDEAIALGEDRGENGMFCSSFLPGEDWTGTPYQPIWADACRRDVDQARLFYGLLVWEAVMTHGEEWVFYRAEDETRDRPLGMIYFRRGTQ